MILITGATGHFGKAAIQHLLAKGVPASSIGALVREEAKAIDLKEKGVVIKKGDYDDYASLVAAFTGVDKLLLVSGSDINNRSSQQTNAVKAAKEAGVPYILYTSFERKNETESSPIAFVAKSHIQTEQQIKASGIRYTIFKNNLYLDLIPVFIGDKALDTGIFWPAGDGVLAAALRDEMAEAASNVLTSDTHEGNEYSISNTINTSFQQVADELSKIAGKTVPYISPEPAVYTDTLTKAGVPAEYVGMFGAFAAAIKENEFEAHQTDLEKLLGRKPLSTVDYLKQVYSIVN